ncbi:MAG: 3'-5' exonuclease [Cyclobacteriaceae bacterium]|nr:3'-5' exonuclease [Cyclobacteriaceae bacterium]MDW8330719.1 3'-5' exonuclease [Cyclobacteriaceae bacterium]
MIAELRDILFLDIETVACTADYGSLDERMRTQWERKASWLKREEGLSDEQLFHQRAAIYAEFGKIVCIGVGIIRENERGEPLLRLKAYYGHDEKALLNDFKLMLEKLNTSTTRLCAHNGREFDFPYLSRRMLVNGIPLPALLDLSGKKPWEVNHLDTLEMWKFGDYKHYTSLDLLAAIFNIPSSKNGMDGSMVNTVYYQEKNLEKIKRYCLSDVVVLTQLYMRLKSLPLIPEQNIEEAVTTP